MSYCCFLQDDARTESGKLASTSQSDFANPQQRGVFSLANSYCDVLYSDKPYARDTKAVDHAMDAFLLHCLNHCTKTGDRIKKNNEKLKAEGEFSLLCCVRALSHTMLVPAGNVVIVTVDSWCIKA